MMGRRRLKPRTSNCTHRRRYQISGRDVDVHLVLLGPRRTQSVGPRAGGAPACRRRRSNLDQWAAVPGDQLPEFMERAIADNSFVLIMCTPRYKTKSEAREGGVGYEGDIITGELLKSRNHRKFIPVLRSGVWSASAPSWLAGKYYIDLREGERYEAQYEDLVSTVHGNPTDGAAGRCSSGCNICARDNIGGFGRRARTNCWSHRRRGD